MKNWNERKFFWLIFGVTTFFALFFSAILHLIDNEAFYWAWAKEPSLSYYSHPPLQAWVTAIFIKFFGDYAFVVRLPLFFARLSFVYFMFLWAKKKYSETTAYLSLCVLMVSSFCIFSSVIAFPDAFMLPFSAMVLYYAEERKVFPTAIFLGFAALAKWFAILLVPGVIAAFLIKNKNPKKYMQLVLVAALSMLMQLPVLVWNYENEWAGILFQLKERHGHAYHYFVDYIKHAGNFISYQLLLSSVAVFVLFPLRKKIVWSWNSWVRPVYGVSVLYWILPTILLFAVSAVKDGNMHVYWTWWFFVPLFFEIVHGLRLDDATFRKFKKLIFFALAFHFLLTPLAAFFPLGNSREIDDVSKGGKIKIKNTMAGGMLGYDEWAQDIYYTEIEKNFPAIKPFFIASDFHVASQIAWALRLQKMDRFFVAGSQNQFQFWKPKISSANEEQFKLTPFIFINDHRYQEFHKYENLCLEAVKWRAYDYFQSDVLVKRIHWAICKKPNIELIKKI